jgi:mono/diheme cytochrome c family protein
MLGGWRRLSLAGFVAIVLTAGTASLPEGDGKKAIEGACAACHSLEIVAQQHWTKEKWLLVVDDMVARGAKLEKGEKPRVLDYLADHFGPLDPGRELVQDICTQCHELDRLNDQELTAAQWSDLIKGMVSEGPPVTDKEFKQIVDYLARNFGPGSIERSQGKQ